MSEQHEQCPECGQRIQVHPGFTTWCEHCHWNIDPEATEESKRDRLWNKMNHWAGARRNAAVFEEARTEIDRGFKMTLPRIMAYVFATLWYGMVLWLIYETIVVFYQVYTMSDFVLGVFLAGLTFVLLPRVYAVKAPRLGRQEYPAIYEAVDQIAKYLDAPPIDGIVIYRGFNAAYTVSGYRRKKLFLIGLPLFASLSAEEKLAILAHEMGHHANKDITRSSYLRGVQRSIWRLYASMYPKTDYSELFDFLHKIQRWIRIGLSYPVLLLWYAMGVAVWKDSQKAEYYADYAAVSVAGVQAASSGLKKFCYAPTFSKTWESVAKYQYTKHLFDEYRSRTRTVPAKEVERIRLLTEIGEQRIESTHPPTRYRLQYMEEKSNVTYPVIPQSLLARMEEEFLVLEAKWEKQMLADYRSYIYDL